MTVIRGDDKRIVSNLSIPIDVGASDNWKLVASKQGYETYEQPITFEDDFLKTVVIELKAKPRDSHVGALQK